MIIVQKQEDLLVMHDPGDYHPVASTGVQHKLGQTTLVPLQDIQFLGFVVNSVTMTMSLLEEKVKSIVMKCQVTLKQEKATVRELSRKLGKMTAASQAVLPAPLCYWNLQ